MKCDLTYVCGLATVLSLSTILWAQPEPPPADGDRPRPRFGPGGSPPNFGPGAPPFGRAGPVFQEQKIVKGFDKDGDKRLNAEERKAAREVLAKRRRPGPPGGFRPQQTAPEPGPKMTPTEVKRYANEPLYDMRPVRTLFLEFENADWEDELAGFHGTDVEVPAKLTVDGKVYPDVGVHFRGGSSFIMVGTGRKRSLNLSLDFIHEDHRLGGYRTLNLLNSAGNSTFLRSVLFLHIARQYIPAPKANYVRVVINRESWGIYVSAQQFNSDFVNEWFKTTEGARWKVPGSPRGRGGLEYLGDESAPYKRFYEIKSKNDARSWADLINLCKVLNETPPERLQKALEPILDVEGVLKFLALEKAMINSDGYWTRASDYNIYQDRKGRFHIVPHDANEILRPADAFGPGGPPRGLGPGRRPEGPVPDGPPPGFGPEFRPPGGFSRGPRPETVDLDPFAGAKDADKPLLSKLLVVPSLRQKYVRYIREITEKWLDWKRLAPLANQYQSVIAEDIKTDTRKLYTADAFVAGVAGKPSDNGFGPGAGPRMSLQAFVEERRRYLLNHSEIGK